MARKYWDYRKVEQRAHSLIEAATERISKVGIEDFREILLGYLGDMFRNYRVLENTRQDSILFPGALSNYLIAKSLYLSGFLALSNLIKDGPLINRLNQHQELFEHLAENLELERRSTTERPEKLLESLAD